MILFTRTALLGETFVLVMSCYHFVLWGRERLFSHWNWCHPCLNLLDVLKQKNYLLAPLRKILVNEAHAGEQGVQVKKKKIHKTKINPLSEEVRLGNKAYLFWVGELGGALEHLIEALFSCIKMEIRMKKNIRIWFRAASLYLCCFQTL